MDSRPHWIGIFIAVALTGVAIFAAAVTVQPASSAGLVALVVAATAFPTIALWASRISSIELVQSTARSSRARNELIGLAIASLREDIRASAELQSKAIVAAVDASKSATETASREIVREIRSLAETISRVGAEEVRALGEARKASELQAQATLALKELQVQAEGRARPQVHVQTQVRSHWLFFHHNWLLVANTAGRARGVTVEIRFLPQNSWARIPVPGFDLDIQQQSEFDIGDVNTTGGSNRVWVQLRYRDNADRQYVAVVDLPLGGNLWTPAATRTID